MEENMNTIEQRWVYKFKEEEEKKGYQECFLLLEALYSYDYMLYQKVKSLEATKEEIDNAKKYIPIMIAIASLIKDLEIYQDPKYKPNKDIIQIIEDSLYRFIDIRTIPKDTIELIQSLLQQYYKDFPDFPKNTPITVVELKIIISRWMRINIEEEHAQYANFYIPEVTSPQSPTVGIGGQVESEKEDPLEKYFYISEVDILSSGYNAGLKSGDRIYLINGKKFSSNDEFIKLIRERGTDNFNITVLKNGELKEIELALTPPRNVIFTKLGEDEYGITFHRFSDAIAEEFINGLDILKPKKVILDIRNNRGGEVSAMISIADIFVDTTIEDRQLYGDKARETTEINGIPNRSEIEIVVVVGQNTTSSAELLAAILQKNGHKVCGSTTFGKKTGIGSAHLEKGTYHIDIPLFEGISPKIPMTPNCQISELSETYREYLREK